MIITQLLGGLGNQMFQYAVGRALATKHRTVLKLDTSKFKDYRFRSYRLEHFAICAEELDAADAPTMPSASGRRIREVIGRFFGREPLPVVRERQFAFESSIFDSPSTCYLLGYWQSPKYFASIETEIRREFTVREPLSGLNLEMATRIENCAAVSLHVRRGDYVNNPNTNRFHGTCDPGYYEAAERKLLEHLGAFHLFVFSDDLDWVKDNLRFISPVTFVTHNGVADDYEDLRLMTLCQHHIIANSTFSWWGAWLCANPHKTVVGPRNWFRDPRQNTSDLFPEKWIRI